MAERSIDSEAPVVLALDTAGAACSAAVCRGRNALAVERQAMRHGHATVVLPMIQRVLETAGLTFADIDRYVVNRGPGGFTGLRVGLAAMGGLALATGRPIAGIDGFDVLAQQARGLTPLKGPLVVAIDSRRPDPYVLVYDETGRRRGDPRSLAREGLADFLRQAAVPGGRLAVIGDAAPAVASAGGPVEIELLPVNGPDPIVLAWLGQAAPAALQPPTPLYIRPVDAVPAPPARELSP